MHKEACDPGIKPNEHMQVRLIELCRRRELDRCSGELGWDKGVQGKA